MIYRHHGNPWSPSNKSHQRPAWRHSPLLGQKRKSGHVNIYVGNNMVVNLGSAGIKQIMYNDASFTAAGMSRPRFALLSAVQRTSSECRFVGN